jgi:hypothetical protein
MKTVLTRLVDDKRVVIGIDDAPLDPAATQKKISPLVSSDEKLLKILTTEKDHSKRFRMAIRRRKEIAEENAVYSIPGENEFLLTESELNSLNDLMKKADADEVVVREDDGSFCAIKDYRGKTAWKKNGDAWESREIKTLGDAPGDGETTVLEEWMKGQIATQKNKEIIASLSSEEKAALKEIETGRALREAAMKKIELDIIGEPDSSLQAKNFFAEEKKKIEEKYK